MRVVMILGVVGAFLALMMIAVPVAGYKDALGAFFFVVSVALAVNSICGQWLLNEKEKLTVALEEERERYETFLTHVMDLGQEALDLALRRRAEKFAAARDAQTTFLETLAQKRTEALRLEDPRVRALAYERIEAHLASDKYLETNVSRARSDFWDLWNRAKNKIEPRLTARGSELVIRSGMADYLGGEGPLPPPRESLEPLDQASNAPASRTREAQEEFLER